MNDNRALHFEELWEKAEGISTAQFPNSNDVLEKLVEILEDLRAMHRLGLDTSSSSALLATELKKKTIGRLLYALTAYSQKENIDVYSALKYELNVLKIKDKLEKAIPEEELDGIEPTS